MATNLKNYPNVIFIPPPSPEPTPPHPEAHLTTQDRLKLAKKRRAAQLKRWVQREREKNAPDVVPKSNSSSSSINRKNKRRPAQRDSIQFVANVMLLEAAARNDIEEVRRLLKMGISPDSTNEDGLTALHQCCIDNSEEMMRLLVEYGGNTNATDTEKWTPLHAAATCGHLHLVKFLIDHGANLLAVNNDGNMPYDLCDDDTTLSYIENEMAKRGVTQELIDETRSTTERQMLHDLQRGPSDMLEWRDEQGATPLHIASANGYLSVVEYLLDNHVTTDSVDNDLWQPIHAAACWGHLEVVEILAQNGANINAKNRNGETPYDICEDPEIKERLIQLKEQRVRSEQPRVRRSRSASTRTQSIRRTSLREKMNVTKKDVQEEKLYFIQSFDSVPTSEKEKSYNNFPIEKEAQKESKPVVDINDVQLSFHQSPNGARDKLDANSSSHPDLPPKRPPRTGGSIVQSSPNSLTPPGGSSNLTDKINIHVSVTINTPDSTSSRLTSGTTTSPITQQSPMIAGLTSNGSATGTTLSDLKKARSKSRTMTTASSSGQSNVVPTPNFTQSSPFFHSDLGEATPPLPPPHITPTTRGSLKTKKSKTSSSHGQRNPKLDDLTPENGNLVQKYSSPVEVVGPTTTEKKGCCIIM